MFAKWAQCLQLDRSLQYVILGRLWQVLSGPVTIALVIRMLSMEEQGIYYGLIGVVGIQAFFELGLLSVLVSQASHEHAILSRESRDGSNLEIRSAEQRLNTLITSSRRWFTFASALFAGGAICLAFFTFEDTQTAQWLAPMLLLIPLAALTVFLSPSISILEGSGYREDVYRFRFYQMLTGSLAVWLGLELGLSLWVLPLSTFVQVAWMSYQVRLHQHDFFNRFTDSTFSTDEINANGYSWSRDVMPIQWRAALTSIAYHVATQMFTVIIIKFHSLEEAAPLGMTMTAVAAIQLLSQAWVQTKLPLASKLHGDGNREAAGTLWRKIGVISSGILIASFAGFAVAISQLPALEMLIGKSLVDRFITPSQIIVLGIGALANHLITLQGAYVLSQRAKPLALAIAIGFGAIAAAVWLGGYLYSINGIVGGYTLGMVFCALPVHTFAYLRFRKGK